MDIFKEDSTGMILALDNLSKANLSKMANEIVFTSLNGGYEDPLEAYVKAKGLGEIADGIMTGLKDYAIKEAYKFDKEQKVIGCSVLVKSVPNTYDFSSNPSWVHLNNEINRLKAEQKEIEKQMILAIGYSEMVSADGEIIQPAVVKKAGGETIQVTIPK
jgi:hypothetical protein